MMKERVATSTNSAFIPLFEGQQFEHFAIHEYRDSGQFSLVFEAQHTNTGEQVAVKILTPASDSNALYEFQREADLLKDLAKADNVVNLISTGSKPIQVQIQQGAQLPLPFHYHILELADGVLEEIVLKRHDVSLRERLQLWRSVVRGIHQMHCKQVVHRDLKSSNCLVFAKCDSKSRAKVSDLGRGANTKKPHHFRPQDYFTGRGDFRFACPECLYAQAEIDRRSCKNADIYGLGSLLFELVTGQGITSQALGYGPRIVQESLRHARSGRAIDLSSLRGKFEDAFLLFEHEMPIAIRQSAGTLLRQLCDPVPEMRSPNMRLGRHSVVPDDLEWLLRKADIVIKRLEVSQRQAKKIGPKADVRI